MEWVSIKDKKPPMRDLILVYFGTMFITPRERIFLARRLGEQIVQEDGKEFDKSNEVTHWMHLPKEPNDKTAE